MGIVDKYTGLTDSQMRDHRYFCWVHFTETEGCVHCLFNDEADMFHLCLECNPNATIEIGPWGWGWRGICVRGLSIGSYSDVQTRQLMNHHNGNN